MIKQWIAHLFFLGTLMSLCCSFFRVAAQPSGKRVDKDLEELHRIGVKIARAVREKDWATVLSYERSDWRRDHEESLKDKTSDIYCFLVDSKCKAVRSVGPSIFEQLSAARDLGIATSDFGGSPTDHRRYAVLLFYDRSMISERLVESPSFYCRPENFKRIVFWTFRLVNGKWEASTWLFNFASDSPC